MHLNEDFENIYTNSSIELSIYIYDGQIDGRMTFRHALCNERWDI